MSDLDALRSLAEVVRCGSVTEAARRLAISQPAVSGHLRLLEARFGRPLVERRGRGIRPTAFAEDVAARVGPAADALAETLEDAAPGPRAPVRIAGPGTYLAVRAVPALASLEDVRTTLLALSDPDALADRLEAGEVDLAVFPSRPNPSRFETRDLDVARVALVGAPAFAHLAERPLLEVMGAAPYLAVDARLSHYRDLARGEGLAPEDLPARVPPPRLVFDDARALILAAVAGAGIAAVPEPLAAEALESGALVRLDGHTGIGSPMRIGWSRARLLTANVRRVRDRLVEAARVQERLELRTLASSSSNVPGRLRA